LSMRLGGPGRLDFKKFKEEKRAGTALLILALVGSAVAAGLVWYESYVSNNYVSTEAYTIYNVPAFEKLLKENKYVAVMFRSLTCPHCEKMLPYWLKLEMSQGKVRFVDVVYGTNTATLFQRYKVEGTPTFILFKDGKPVARHEGEFIAENVTEAMLNWALSAVGTPVLAGYQTYLAKCSVCHGAPASTSREDLLEWAKSERNGIGRLLLEAYRKRVTLEELLGSEDAIKERIWGMARRNNVPLDQKTVDETAKFLQAVSEVLIGKKEVNAASMSAGTTEIPSSGSAAPALMFLVGLAAGVGAAVSPCNFPLFVTYVTRGLRERRSSALSAVSCAAAAAVGVAFLGALFLAFSTAALELQKFLIPVVGTVIVAISAASLLKVPISFSAGSLGKTGGKAFCFIYGFLSVQCNLPLVIGALLLIASGGGFQTLAGFALGVAAPLFAVSWAGPRVRGLAEKIVRNSERIELITNAFMLAAGIYLLFYGATLM